MSTITIVKLPEYDDAKMQFFQNDIADKSSIIQKIEAVNAQPLTSNARVHQIEENTEAINILDRFHKDECIVCDTKNIDRKNLLATKTQNRKIIIDTLSADVKSLIEKIIALVPASDPFQIKSRLIDAISKGDNEEIIIFQVWDLKTLAFRRYLC